MKLAEIFPARSLPLWIRCVLGALAFAVLGYAVIGVYHNDLFMPGRYTGPYSQGGVHFRGFAAWLMLAALVCPACWMLSGIVYHYDRRNNEGAYRRLSRALFRWWWILFFAAISAQLAPVLLTK